jgi:hypothetical protein
MRLRPPPAGGHRVRAAQQGPPPGLNIRRGGRRRQKPKKNNFRNFALVLAIAFLFLFTPAQERIQSQLTKWFDDLIDEFGPAREYPVYAVYTVERRVNLLNPYSGDMPFTYELAIPEVRTDFGDSPNGFEMLDGSVTTAETLQVVNRMELHAAFSSTAVTIPVSSVEYRVEANSIALNSQTSVYWPEIGDGQTECDVGRCVIWSGNIPGGQTATLIVEYDVIGSSFSWWGGERSPDEAPISSTGFQIDTTNDGTFADLDRPGRMGQATAAFGDIPQWYDRDSGVGENWAIDAHAAIVRELADEIAASLSTADANSPYAFAHAAFIEVRDTIEYRQGLSPARSGEACLIEGRGDCDEQANAWMSLLRTRGIPSWYEFGPMTDAEYVSWEPHAWANAIFPLDGDWCASKGIAESSCYIEGDVDVVNNKWLLHSPTTMTEWIERASIEGEDAYKFYRPLAISCNNCWTETWTTLGDPVITGGTFRVSVREGV